MGKFVVKMNAEGYRGELNGTIKTLGFFFSLRMEADKVEDLPFLCIELGREYLVSQGFEATERSQISMTQAYHLSDSADIINPCDEYIFYDGGQGDSAWWQAFFPQKARYSVVNLTCDIQLARLLAKVIFRYRRKLGKWPNSVKDIGLLQDYRTVKRYSKGRSISFEVQDECVIVSLGELTQSFTEKECFKPLLEN